MTLLSVSSSVSTWTHVDPQSRIAGPCGVTCGFAVFVDASGPIWIHVDSQFANLWIRVDPHSFTSTHNTADPQVTPHGYAI